MNVTGAPLEGREDDGFNETNDRADRGVAGESIAGNRLFGLFFFLGNLESKGFGGLLENTL